MKWSFALRSRRAPFCGGILSAVRRLILAGALAGSACSGSSTPAVPSTPPTPTVVGLAIAGNTTFTDRGQMSQLLATATLSNGTQQDQTKATTWSSSNAAVVTVSAGLVTSVGAGSAQISASYQGATASVQANVTLLCQTTNTANVSFGNRSNSMSFDIIWDGLQLQTLAPGQTSTPLTVAAGTAHNLIFYVAGTKNLGCVYATVLPAQCSTPVYTCPVNP